MPASWRTFTQAATHCSSKPYSRSNSASVSPRMIARIVPNSPFTTILPSYSQKYNGRGDWLINLYAKRWGIECAFRDTKDLRFGMGEAGKGSAGASRWKASRGMGSVHVSSPDRRDRLWLINAFAVVLLTLLGASGEALGHDRHLKSNTVKRRTHSLFRQGSMLYELIPTMPEHRLWPLIEKFAEMLAAQPVFAQMFGAI